MKINEMICLLFIYLCVFKFEFGKIKFKKIDFYSMRKIISFIYLIYNELEDERFMKSYIYKYDFY